MNPKVLKLVLVSTPIGFLGSGKGGGVELTVISAIRGLLQLGIEITLVAPKGSELPPDCKRVKIVFVEGTDQVSWQHRDFLSPVEIPFNSVLEGLWKHALVLGKDADAILNFSYDWLPFWITPFVDVKIFHLVSMGAVSTVMRKVINDLSIQYHERLAFHTKVQSSDYTLSSFPTLLGNGFDLTKYHFREQSIGYLGWAGRVSPEKGLEDALSVARRLGESLYVWGLVEDQKYAKKIESLFPEGTIHWRGFLETSEFQLELGGARMLINTPKWNEAYGNVVVEAMACGVPVVSYQKGGPGELICSGSTGWLVPKDDLEALYSATLRINEINRRDCRNWVEENASLESFGTKIKSWIFMEK